MGRLQPLHWVSHRGFHKVYPENTREAFSEARKRGFGAVETDLHLSSDGHLVLVHDPDLNRILGVDRLICDLTREQLEALRFESGSSLLFFDDFASEYFDLTWTLDIKIGSAERCVDALRTWANTSERREKLTDDCKFLMWSLSGEAYCRERLSVETFYAQKSECYWAGLGILSGFMSLGRIQKQKTYSMPRHLGPFDLFQEKYVERFHRLGVKVTAFLPSEGSDTSAAINSGFDEILTNHGILEA